MHTFERQHRPPRSPRAQVSEALAGLLNQRQPGERLPPEPQLAQQLGVSRATLREAMRSFEERGRIVRRHGVGTFVAALPPVIESGLEELESLHTMAQRIGLETHMGEAEIVERAATPDEAERLSIPVGAPVLAVSRVMMTGAQPIAYLVDVVPIAFLHCQDLEGTFNGSVLDVFLQRSQPALSHSRTDIMTATANGTLAHKLGLRRGGMLLRLEAQLCARDGQIVDYSLSYFVPGHFRFHVVRRVGKINGESALAKT